MLLDRLASLVPAPFLSEARIRAGLFLGGFLYLLDGYAELIRLARMAAMPGQVDLPGVPGWGGFDNWDALAYIGADRGFAQGLTQSYPDFALELRRWRAARALSATPYQLLERMAAILSPNPPRLRLISAGGEWWVRETTGVIRYYNQLGMGISYDPTSGAAAPLSDVPHAWDWDSASVPPPPHQNDAGRFWIVFDMPCTSPYGTGLYGDGSDGVFVDQGLVDDYWDRLGTSGAGPSPDAGLVGVSVPRKWLDLFRSQLLEWRSMGLRCEYIIASFDPTAFLPLTDSTPTSIPDGTWGWHTKYDSGSNSRVVARFPNAEYIDGRGSPLDHN